MACSGFGHAPSHFSTFNSAVVACKKRSDWQVHLGMRRLHRKKLFSWFEVIRNSLSYWNSMWSLGLCRGHYASYLRCAKKQFCQMWFFTILSWVAAAKVADGGRKTKTDFVWNHVYNALGNASIFASRQQRNCCHTGRLSLCWSKSATSHCSQVLQLDYKLKFSKFINASAHWNWKKSWPR